MSERIEDTLGTYRGSVNSGVVAKYEGKAVTIQIGFTVTHIKEGVHWEELQEPLNRNMFWPTSEKALPFTNQKMKALGFNGKYRAMEFANGENVEFVCKQNGEYQQWDIRSWGDSDIPVADDATINDLERQWRAENGNTAKPSQSKPQPQQASGPPRVSTPTKASTQSDDSAVETATNENGAWDICQRTCGDEASTSWNNAVNQIATETGRSQDSFTPGDWKNVCEHFQVPF